MEGRPWLRIALLLVGFSLVGIPVWSMTRERTPSDAVALIDVAVESLPLRLVVSFSSAPVSFTLKHLDEVLCTGTTPEREFSRDWQFGIPTEGIELLLKAEWPPDAEKTAVRVEVFRENEVFVDQTFWTKGRLVQSVTVPGTHSE